MPSSFHLLWGSGGYERRLSSRVFLFVGMNDFLPFFLFPLLFIYLFIFFFFLFRLEPSILVINFLYLVRDYLFG